MKVWLSIDFDYFVREPREWDHDEGHNTKVWAQRFRASAKRGKSLRREMDPNVFAMPTPREFWDRIAALGYDLRKVKTLCLADSHAWARDFFCEPITPADAESERLMVHFDTHHDLGYHNTPLKLSRITNFDCENWQLAVLQHYPSLRSKVVYPPWRGLDEMHHHSKWCALDDISRRVTIGAFADEYVHLPPGYEVDAVFLCRSPAWTPPWLDMEFKKFVELLKMHAPGVAIVRPFMNEVEEMDPLQVRTWIDPV